MNSRIISTELAVTTASSVRKPYYALWLAGPLLVAGLLGCGHSPETARAPAIAPVAPAPALVAASPMVAAGSTVAAAPKPALKPLVPARAKPVQPMAAVHIATPTAPTVEEVPAPVPVAAPAAPTTRTQAGRVLDEAGQPLVGATVMLKGSTSITSTDANGSYSFEVPAGENTFLIGYGGYEDEVAKSRNGEPLTVTLLPKPDSKGRVRRARHL